MVWFIVGKFSKMSMYAFKSNKFISLCKYMHDFFFNSSINQNINRNKFEHKIWFTKESKQIIKLKNAFE